MILNKLIACAKGITCHSDHVRPGYIFVAIRGRTTDGNTFAQTAAAKGALAVVTDCPDNVPNLNTPIITVPDARLALSAIAAKFYNDPSHALNLVGVTGSNGKTTITYMLEHIFHQAGLTAGIIGTIRVNTGKTTFPSQLTTPDAVSVQQYLAQMRKNAVTHAAMEVSAQGLDMKRVEHVRFTVGILSNLCPDHLDFHGDFAGYLAAKAKFLDLLTPDTPLIVNVADPDCQAMSSRYTGRLITVAVHGEADISAKVTHVTAYGSSFVLEINRPIVTTDGRVTPQGNYLLRLPAPGLHNVENALLAATAALLLGIAPATIVQALAEFKGVERRMNLFHTGGLTVIDDTALNPGSIDAVFTTIKSFRYNKLIAVNAIRGQRGSAINAANAAAIATWQSKLPFELIVTASSGHTGPADNVAACERLAFLATLNTLKVNYTYSNTLSGALRAALLAAVPGDLLALIGAQGMDSGRQVLSTLIQSGWQSESRNLGGQESGVRSQNSGVRI